MYFIKFLMRAYLMCVYMYKCIDYVACVIYVNIYICTMIEGLGVELSFLL